MVRGVQQIKNGQNSVLSEEKKKTIHLLHLVSCVYFFHLKFKKKPHLKWKEKWSIIRPEFSKDKKVIFQKIFTVK